MEWTSVGLELLWRLPLTVGAALLISMATAHLVRSRRTGSPDGGAAWSFECWARVVGGEHPQLSRRWRVGRAIVSPGRVELGLYWKGLRLRRLPAFVVDVDAVDRDGVQRAGWLTSLRFDARCRLVTVSTTAGAGVQLAVPAGDLAVVLDLLEGRHLPATEEPGAPERLWPFPRTVTVTCRPAAPANGSDDGDDGVPSQLHRCLDDARRQLSAEGMSLADVQHLQIRTTDAHAVSVSVRELASRLRDAGAAPSISVLGVPRLAVPDRVVEVEATATALLDRPPAGEPR